MGFTEGAVTILVITAVIILGWSIVQRQKISDTLQEIIDLIKDNRVTHGGQ